MLGEYPALRRDVSEDAQACMSTAARLGYPVVMKGLQPGGVHKTEMGLVQLDIRNKTSAARAFKSLTKKMQGKGSVLVQKQVKGHAELIMGMLRDPQFGPCIMIGSRWSHGRGLQGHRLRRGAPHSPGGAGPHRTHQGSKAPGRLPRRTAC